MKSWKKEKMLSSGSTGSFLWFFKYYGQRQQYRTVRMQLTGVSPGAWECRGQRFCRSEEVEAYGVDKSMR